MLDSFRQGRFYPDLLDQDSHSSVIEHRAFRDSRFASNRASPSGVESLSLKQTQGRDDQTITNLRSFALRDAASLRLKHVRDVLPAQS